MKKIVKMYSNGLISQNIRRPCLTMVLKGKHGAVQLVLSKSFALDIINDANAPQVILAIHSLHKISDTDIFNKNEFSDARPCLWLRGEKSYFKSMELNPESYYLILNGDVDIWDLLSTYYHYYFSKFY